MNKIIEDNNIDNLLDLYNKLNKVKSKIKEKYNYIVTVKFVNSKLVIDGHRISKENSN